MNNNCVMDANVGEMDWECMFSCHCDLSVCTVMPRLPSAAEGWRAQQYS